MASFAIIKGPKEFILDTLLLNKTRWPIAWSYVISIVFTVWAAMIRKSYLYTIVGLSVELLCLLYFLCSYFPGGKTGFKYMLKLAWALVQKTFACCTKDL